MADLERWRRIAKKHPPVYCVYTGSCEFKSIEREQLGVYQIKCKNGKELCTKQTTVPQRIRIPFGR
jgi:hypothetical protein